MAGLKTLIQIRRPDGRPKNLKPLTFIMFFNIKKFMMMISIQYMITINIFIIYLLWWRWGRGITSVRRPGGRPKTLIQIRRPDGRPKNLTSNPPAGRPA